MAVIKIFDSKGVKTIEMLGNANEQDYDLPEEDLLSADQDPEAEE